MKAILQFGASHLWGLSPVCLLMCKVRGPMSLKPLPQISHVWGYCKNTQIFAKVKQKTSEMNLNLRNNNLFSPTFPSWISMCLFLLHDLLNLAPQTSQTNGLSPEPTKKPVSFVPGGISTQKPKRHEYTDQIGKLRKSWNHTRVLSHVFLQFGIQSKCFWTQITLERLFPWNTPETLLVTDWFCSWKRLKKTLYFFGWWSHVSGSATTWV